MSFNFIYGDIVNRDGYNSPYYIYPVSGAILVTWVDNQGRPHAVSYDEIDVEESVWVHTVHRDGEQIYPNPDPDPEFKFGDRVINRITPESKVVFLKHNLDGRTADVAYHDPNGAVSVEATYLDILSPA